jgi:hypothetical protein
MRGRSWHAFSANCPPPWMLTSQRLRGRHRDAADDSLALLRLMSASVDEIASVPSFLPLIGPSGTRDIVRL